MQYDKGDKSMEYNGYRINETDEGVEIENIRDFNLQHTFECGQCFRWIKQKQGSYTGVANGKVVNISGEGERLRILNTTLKEFKDFWFEYFDLGRDYGEIKRQLSKDPILKEAVKFGHGIRLLRQDIWETLISFIISANNRIPMIMRCVDKLSQRFGKKLIFNDEEYYSFPDVEQLKDATLENIELCRAGFRCRYILGTSGLIAHGEVKLEKLKEMSTPDARKELIKLPGVGAKVADCVLLYSGTKYDVFPTDVWVKRVMEELYLKKEASFGEIQQFAAQHFGDLAGFAQQYLFFYTRENRIGT
jgi:N-glycosylase/DNA lyase